MAKANPTPPADFKIKTAAEMAAEKEEELKKTNPAIGALVEPQRTIALAGRADLLRQLDERRGGAQAEGLDHFRQASGEVQRVDGQHGGQGSARQRDAETGGLRRHHGRAVNRQAGRRACEVEFEGIGDSFTKDPALMVTFDVEKCKIESCRGDPLVCSGPLKEEKVAPVHHTAKKKS